MNNESPLCKSVFGNGLILAKKWSRDKISYTLSYDKIWWFITEVLMTTNILNKLFLHKKYWGSEPEKNED